MASVDEQESDDGTSRFEAFSDYRSVTQRIGRKVSEAQRAYSILHASAREGVDIGEQEIAEARAAILEAALALNVEIQAEAQRNGESVFGEIDERWNGSGDDLGRMTQFMELSFRDNAGIPGWLYQFVLDIRRAAWELGYLRAGRRVEESNLGPVEEDVNAMFEGIQL